MEVKERGDDVRVSRKHGEIGRGQDAQMCST